MGERRPPPHWPRLLPEEMAASYVGVSVSQFQRERARGIWPAPVDRGARINTYDRKDLDDAVDRLKGRVNHADPDDIDIDREFGLGSPRFLVEPIDVTDIAVKMPEDRSGDGIVYFVQGEYGGPVKVGFVRGINGLLSRIVGLQTGYPYKIVVRLLIPAVTQAEERRLHKLFDQDRLQGEWFKYSLRMYAFLYQQRRLANKESAVVDGNRVGLNGFLIQSGHA